MSFFEVQLNRTQVARLWESKDMAASEKAAKLQALFDQGLGKQYEVEKEFWEKQKNGESKFRLTDGKVFELFESEKTIEIPIKLQVKGETITWYFIAPKDETHQSWRDELYMAAALSHLSVDGHCEKYWRGTNSLHLKRMHTRQSENQLNHNHYRLNGINVAPLHIKQHLLGFVEAQREIDELRKRGILEASTEGSLTDKFLDEKEAHEISRLFNIWWAKANHVGEEQEIDVEGEHIYLPQREESMIAAYKKLSKQQLTLEDKKEWQEHKNEEEPCGYISQFMSMQEKIKALGNSMRGIGSELASTRQVGWSKHKKIATIVTKDDKFKNEKLVNETT